MTGTLTCLHGAVGSAEDWRGFAWPGWALQRVDLWRFLDCCPMSLPEVGRALNAEAVAGRRSGGPEPRVLLGYSMGGRLALQALLAPGAEVWDAAVLIAPHPGLPTAEDRAARRAGDAEWAARALSGDWQDFLTAWEDQGVLRTSDEGRATRPAAPTLMMSPPRRQVRQGEEGGGTSNIERPTSNVEGAQGRADRLGPPKMDAPPRRQGRQEEEGERTSNIEHRTSNVEGEKEWPDLPERGEPVMADRNGLIGRRREIARSFVDWSLGAQDPLWDRLHEIRCPVLWIAGERDAKFRALAEQAVSLLPVGELWLAPEAGHRVPWDVPASFQDRVAAFLQSR